MTFYNIVPSRPQFLVDHMLKYTSINIYIYVNGPCI